MLVQIHWRVTYIIVRRVDTAEIQIDGHAGYPCIILEQIRRGYEEGRSGWGCVRGQRMWTVCGLDDAARQTGRALRFIRESKIKALLVAPPLTLMLLVLLVTVELLLQLMMVVMMMIGDHVVTAVRHIAGYI